MKVSIITSCYNREATIRGAIESVLEQDYPYIEYIVVDGASKDNSLAVINEYKLHFILSMPGSTQLNSGLGTGWHQMLGMLFSKRK